MESVSIDKFEGNYRFLSNFYKSNFKDKEGILWPSVEHYFQAMKTHNPKEREEIRTAPNPGSAKRAGRKVKLRSDWDQVKENIMYDALYYKFTQNEDLKQMLIDTDVAYLKEGNTWHDQIWGDCYCEKCKNKKGENKLGRLLMLLRSSLK